MAPRSKRATFVTQLKLWDVKSFAGEQYLNLADENGNPARWTLLLGDNGAGKTTLLECITQLSPVFNSGSGAGELDPKLFLEPRISWAENKAIFAFRRVGAMRCRAEAIFVAQAMLDKGAGTESLTNFFEFEFVNDKEDKLEISRWPGEEENEIPDSEWATRSDLTTPLVITYGAGRHMGRGNFDLTAIPEGTDSLLEGDAELFDAEELLLHLYHAALPKSAATAQRQRDLLINTMVDFLPEASEITIHGARAIGEKTAMGVFVRTRDGLVPLKQLSFGYQTMMAWIGDLALRLFKVNPISKQPLATPAIVIIDEIDLHLHPIWQRQIRDLLTRHFPNVQFIVTAHSPLMVQAFLDANLAVVIREGDHSVIDNDPVAVSNWRIDQIVTSDLFGLNSPWAPEYDEILERQARLLGKAKLSAKERNELRKLDAAILDLPTEASPVNETAMRVIRHAARQLAPEG